MIVQFRDTIKLFNKMHHLLNNNIFQPHQRFLCQFEIQPDLFGGGVVFARSSFGQGISSRLNSVDREVQIVSDSLTTAAAKSRFSSTPKPVTTISLNCVTSLSRLTSSELISCCTSVTSVCSAGVGTERATSSALSGRKTVPS